MNDVMIECSLKDIDPRYIKYYLESDGNFVMETSYHILMNDVSEKEQKEWLEKALVELKKRIDNFFEIYKEKP